VTGKRIVSKYRYSDDRFSPFSSTYVGRDLLPCLLPKSDFVFFGEGEQPEAICAWPRMEEILQDKLNPIDCYPKRFEVTEYPSPCEITAMGFDPLPE
jgi:hypothetical protein